MHLDSSRLLKEKQKKKRNLVMSSCPLAVLHVARAHILSMRGKWGDETLPYCFFKDQILFRSTLYSVLFSLVFQNSLLKWIEKHHATYLGFIYSMFFWEPLLRCPYYLKSFSQSLPTSIPRPFDLQSLFGLFITFLSTIALISLIAYYLTLILHRSCTLSFSCLSFLTKVF